MHTLLVVLMMYISISEQSCSFDKFSGQFIGSKVETLYVGRKTIEPLQETYNDFYYEVNLKKRSHHVPNPPTQLGVIITGVESQPIMLPPYYSPPINPGFSVKEIPGHATFERNGFEILRARYNFDPENREICPNPILKANLEITCNIDELLESTTKTAQLTATTWDEELKSPVLDKVEYFIDKAQREPRRLRIHVKVDESLKNGNNRFSVRFLGPLVRGSRRGLRGIVLRYDFSLAGSRFDEDILEVGAQDWLNQFPFVKKMNATAEGKALLESMYEREGGEYRYKCSVYICSNKNKCSRPVSTDIQF